MKGKKLRKRLILDEKYTKLCKKWLFYIVISVFFLKYPQISAISISLVRLRRLRMQASMQVMHLGRTS